MNHKNTIQRLLHSLALIIAHIDHVVQAAQSKRSHNVSTVCLANETARHAFAITKLSAGSISTRWLLGKLNSTDTNQVEVCAAASALPLGVLTDTASTAGEYIAMELLGAIPGTVRVVSAGAISAGVAVYTAASGKVQSLPTAPGNYYQVGTSLTAATAANNELEIVTCVPRAITIESQL